MKYLNWLRLCLLENIATMIIWTYCDYAYLKILRLWLSKIIETMNSWKFWDYDYLKSLRLWILWDYATMEAAKSKVDFICLLWFLLCPGPPRGASGNFHLWKANSGHDKTAAMYLNWFLLKSCWLGMLLTWDQLRKWFW